MRRRRRVNTRDDTTYLLSSVENAKVLRQAIADADSGKRLPPPARRRARKRSKSTSDSRP